ncbi:MAG: tail fiber protein [Elusimicrobia bacterium]|nr:tail fiber protein [Elusimicrobiota bacterium]
MTNVKVSTVSASKIILPGGSTPISTWQLGAGNFIDASKVALPGSTATVASWQYGATGFIDVAKVTGTIPTTPVAHATSHGLVGTDPLNGLSPLQISGSAVVLRSTSSQTIQPQVGSDVVPLVIKPNASVPAGSINALEVFTNASTTSVTIRGDGLMTVKGTLTANGPVNATNGLTITGSLNVSTIVPSGNLNISGRVRDNYGYLVPPGTIVAFAGTTAPSGWLLCDGSTKDKSIQPELSELKLVLGSTYGAETANTFVLPNLKGRVPMGSGIGASATNWTIGISTGSETYTLSIAQIPPHHHGGVVISHTTDEFSANNSQAIKTITYGNTQDEGGGQPHPIMQPSLVVNYIIKY